MSSYLTVLTTCSLVVALDSPDLIPDSIVPVLVDQACEPVPNSVANLLVDSCSAANHVLAGIAVAGEEEKMEAVAIVDEVNAAAEAEIVRALLNMPAEEDPGYMRSASLIVMDMRWGLVVVARPAGRRSVFGREDSWESEVDSPGTELETERRNLVVRGVHACVVFGLVRLRVTRYDGGRDMVGDGGLAAVVVVADSVARRLPLLLHDGVRVLSCFERACAQRSPQLRVQQEP